MEQSGALPLAGRDREGFNEVEQPELTNKFARRHEYASPEILHTEGVGQRLPNYTQDSLWTPTRLHSTTSGIFERLLATKTQLHLAKQSGTTPRHLHTERGFFRKFLEILDMASRFTI